MKRIFWIGALLAAGCGTNGRGERCNPLRATSDCDSGLTCVYPTGTNCGVSYCCAVDAQGNITDKDPNCQPDPASAAVCGFDLSTADGPLDGGHD
jgi:hypothetical protein